MFLKILKTLLLPFAVLYGIIMWLRNKLYDVGFFKSVQFSIPVVSVGNLSTGGTGKTPHIEYLIKLLQQEYKVATMSRGYKRKTKGFVLADAATDATTIGDEPMQFHTKFPEAIVSVCEDRMMGIPRLLVERPEIEVVLLDDAYQHRTVRPGLNILLTDFAQPFYKDFVLPLGNLRESRKAYQRADIIIVTKCPADVATAAMNSMKDKIQPAPRQQVFFSTVAYGQLTDFLTGTTLSLPANMNIVMLSGIAKPAPMLHHLRQLANDVSMLQYPDHHNFTNSDLTQIKQRFEDWTVTNKLMVTTEKDVARLRIHQQELASWGITIAVLPITIKFINEVGAFEKRVRDYIADVQ